MEVIYKEGIVYLQGAKFGKKTWRKSWMVLFKASPMGVGRLELSHYSDWCCMGEQRKPGRQKSAERKVVRLSDCLSATCAPKESCPSGCTAFYLTTTHATYTLASQVSEEWLSALCLLAFKGDPGETGGGGFGEENSSAMEDNVLYSTWTADPTLTSNKFKVTVHSTPASKRCKLEGDYLISPAAEDLQLFSIDTGEILYRWPYRLLRRFGQMKGGFGIEAGRRCHSGEGLFTFLSRHAPHLFRVIAKRCSLDLESCAPSGTNHKKVASELSNTTGGRPADPPLSRDPSTDVEDDSSNYYSQVNHAGTSKPTKPSPRSRDNPPDRSGSTEKDEVEAVYGRCLSMEALNLNALLDDSIYYNFLPPPIRKAKTEDSDCLYSHLTAKDSSPDLPPEPLYSLITPLTPLPPMLLDPHTVPKRPSLHLPPVEELSKHNAVPQLADDTKEEEEEEGEEEAADAPNSSCRGAPAEAPGTFKHKLAEILSKDVAKLQPPPPPHGGAGFTSSQ